MTRLTQIEGIGEKYASKLQSIGIRSLEDLLREGAEPYRRSKLAKNSGISDKLLLKWINHADLTRIKGVSEEYADLLEYAGVDTIPELATRDADHLYISLQETNTERRCVRRIPSLQEVEDWIIEAKTLPRVVKY